MLTDRGRKALRPAAPALDDVCRALADLRVIVGKIDTVLEEAQVTAAEVRALVAKRSGTAVEADMADTTT